MLHQIYTYLVYHERIKHIKVDFQYMQEGVDKWVIILSYVSNDLQIAYVFIKYIARQHH